LTLTLVAAAAAAGTTTTCWFDSPGTRVAHQAVGTTSTGWLGSRGASVAQDQVATIAMPSTFAGADLLVASVAADGPDTSPATTITTPTTAVFDGTAGLRWTRVAHVSARHDWATPGAHLELYGASVAEIWTTTPPAHWTPTGDVTVANSHPNTRDDGMTITIAGFANAQIDEAVTFDGLAGMPEHMPVFVPNDSAIYAATFAGRVNAYFTPIANFHRVIERRAGDDTAGVIASNNRDLLAGIIDVGNIAPDPGNYWEVAVAVITAMLEDRDPRRRSCATSREFSHARARWGERPRGGREPCRDRACVHAFRRAQGRVRTLVFVLSGKLGTTLVHAAVVP
jgi:hypothetical protein